MKPGWVHTKSAWLENGLWTIAGQPMLEVMSWRVRWQSSGRMEEVALVVARFSSGPGLRGLRLRIAHGWQAVRQPTAEG